MKKYPGMKYNKNLQNQLELIRKKADTTPEDEDPELCFKGRDIYEFADTANLLAKSDENCSNDGQKNKLVGFPVLMRFLLYIIPGPAFCLSP